MGRAPCCDKTKVKKGPWSPEEDETLKNYIEKYGTGGNWIALPLKAGLKRCGKSCRLRWLNYLRPDIKHGGFTDEEDNTIFTLYSKIGSRWSVIASHLPGRTDNDVKNHWNTKLKKKIMAAATNNNNSTPLISSVNHNYNPYNSNPTSSTLHALSPSMDLSPKMGPIGAEVNLGTDINSQSLMQGLAHPAGLTTQFCDQFRDSTSIINHMTSTWSEGNNASSSSSGGEFGFSMDLSATGYSLDDHHQLWPHDQETISNGGIGTSYADLVDFLLS